MAGYWPLPQPLWRPLSWRHPWCNVAWCHVWWKHDMSSLGDCSWKPALTEVTLCPSRNNELHAHHSFVLLVWLTLGLFLKVSQSVSQAFSQSVRPSIYLSSEISGPSSDSGGGSGQIQGGPKKSLHLHATNFNIAQIPLLTYICWRNVHEWNGYTREGLFFSVSILSCHDYFQTTFENVTGVLDIVFCHFGPISSNRLL